MVRPDELVAHARFVRAVARDLVRKPDAADDVAQSTLLIGLERPPRSRDGLMAWIVSVARSVAATLGRRDETRRAHEPSAAVREAQPSTLDVVAHEEIVRRVVDVVFELDEPYRTAILLRYYEDLKPGAIARRLEVPVETVRTRLKRGLARMRERLDERSSGRRGSWTMALTGALRLQPRVAAPFAVQAAAALFVVGGASLLVWRYCGDGDRARTNAATSLDLAAHREPIAPTETPAPTRAVSQEVRSVAATEPIDPAFVVRGTVLDDEGQPLAGARIWVLERDGVESADAPPRLLRDLVVRGYRGEFPPIATTADDGTFAIDGLPLRSNLLLVEADGFGVQTSYARAGKAIRSQLAKSSPLHGVVLDGSTGVPLSDVGVVLGLGFDGMDGGNEWRWARTVSSIDGSYSFEKAPVSRVPILTLDRPGCVPVPGPNEGRRGIDGWQIETRWPPTRRVTGRVVDEASGAPLVNATISFDDDVWHSCSGWQGTDASLRRIATTDANGTFEVELAKDGARVIVSAARHVVCALKLSSPIDADGVVTIALPSAPTILGEVLDADGRPVAGARLLAAADQRRRFELVSRLTGKEGRPSRDSAVSFGPFTSSDAEGRFAFESAFDAVAWSFGFDDFDVQLIAHHPGLGKCSSEVVTLPFGDGIAHVTVRFARKEARRVVAGRLLAGGRGIAGKVRCKAAGELQEVDTDEPGEFAFDVDGSADEAVLTADPIDCRLRADRDCAVHETLRLGPERVTRRDFEIRARRDCISGTIRDTDGHPLAQDRVRAYLSTPDSPYYMFSERTTDANGEYSFDLLDLLGDRFDVSVVHGTWKSSRAGVPLGASGVDFVVPTLGWVRLVVRKKSTGKGVYWPSVESRAVGAEGFVAHASGDGRRPFPDFEGGTEIALPLGTYALRIGSSSDHCDPVTIDRIVASDPPSDPIFVDLPDQPPVRIDVVNDDHSPLPSHLLFLLHDEEWGHVHAKLNDREGWDVSIDKEIDSDRFDVLSRSVAFDSKSTTVEVRATAGRYRLLVQPDDLVVEPAELEVRADSIEPVEVHVHRRLR